MASLKLFLICCVLGGLGGALGSVIGHALGPHALWIGGVAGGLLGALLATRVAVWRRWIAEKQYWATATGSVIGFMAAAALAVHTLSSPIGPVASAALVGLGAMIGSRVRRRQVSPSDGA